MANKPRRARGSSSAEPANPDQVVKSIVEAGSGAYLLLGENGLDLEEVVDRVIESLTTAETRAFNFDEFDASDRETTGEVVSSAVRSFPMLADIRVVVIRTMHDANDSVGSELAHLVDGTIEGTALLMIGEKLDGRKKWAQAVAKHATRFDFGIPKGRAFPAWLKRRAERQGATLSDDAATMLIEFTAQDVWRVASELEKVVLYALPRTEITVDDVEASVGLTREDTVYSLTDRIAERNVDAALGIAHRMAQADAHPAYLVGMIVRHWQTLRLASDLAASSRQKELSALLGENRNWILNKYLTQARTLRREHVRSGFRLALAAESAIKAGWEPTVVLDGLICQLAAR